VNRCENKKVKTLGHEYKKHVQLKKTRAIYICATAVRRSEQVKNKKGALTCDEVKTLAIYISASGASPPHPGESPCARGTGK
jgi:hypothetical protein